MPVALRSAPRVIVPLALLVTLLGCAPGAASTETPADGADGGSGASTETLDCSGVVSEGWELMVDPRASIEPSLDVIPLAAAGDALTFTDTAPNGWTTYGYQLGYIDADGTVFPNRSEIVVGAENTHTFTIDGPFAPSSVDGGPYAGILQIDATDDTGTTVLARVCVELALAE